jgi:hypothetical protein
VQKVRVGLVEVKSFFDDGLTILVKRNASGIVDAGVFKASNLDQERVMALARALVEHGEGSRG